MNDSFTQPKNADGKVWVGPQMEINVHYGKPVVFHGAFKAQVNWGSGMTDPNPLMGLDKVYAVTAVDIHGSYTRIQVLSHPGLWFPSGAFHDVTDNDPSYWGEETN